MSPGPQTGFGDLNPTGRFSDHAEDYRRYRPDYPAAALNAILEGLGDPAELEAADVGAGTGIASRQLAAHGVRVLAVEPNAEMRAAAIPHPGIEWRAGTAEATGLDSGIVGLVLCAQAFHWFRAQQALAEFSRILRPGGRLALMWNSRDRADPLTRAYVEAIHAVNGEHPVEQMAFEPASIAAESNSHDSDGAGDERVVRAARGRAAGAPSSLARGAVGAAARLKGDGRDALRHEGLPRRAAVAGRRGSSDSDCECRLALTNRIDLYFRVEEASMAWEVRGLGGGWPKESAASGSTHGSDAA